MFLGLVFLSLGFLYLTLLSFLDCRMSVCVWPTQTRRVKSGCSWALAYVLLTALLFVFINVNLKNKSSPLLLCPSPTLLPYKAPHAHTKSQPFCFQQIPFYAGHVLKNQKYDSSTIQSKPTFPPNLPPNLSSSHEGLLLAFMAF